MFLTDETEEVPLDDVLAPCYVLHHDLIFDRNLWIALGAEYFYYRYRFTGLPSASWKERETIKESAGVGCETCAYALQARLAEAVEFAEEAQNHKLRAFDVFAGAGAMSLGMEGATGGMRTTHAVEISPSAARTFRYARKGGLEGSCTSMGLTVVHFCLDATPLRQSYTTSA